MWKSSHLSFLDCYRVWVWRVGSFSSVIFGREVIYHLLNQKANSCRDSLECPWSHSKRRAGCSPHLGSEAFSLGSPVRFQAASGLPLVTSLAAAALLPWLSSALVHPGWDTPEQSKGATDLQPDGVCGGGTVFLHVWAAPFNGGLFVSLSAWL